MALREHPRYANFNWPDREWEEFPAMVYPGAADQKKPYGKDGKRLKGILVQNEDERDQALGLGKYAPAEGEEAKAPKLTEEGGVQRLTTAEDEKQALIEKAEVMGVTIDKRWGIARIEQAISEAENPVI